MKKIILLACLFCLAISHIGADSLQKDSTLQLRDSSVLSNLGIDMGYLQHQINEQMANIDMQASEMAALSAIDKSMFEFNFNPLTINSTNNTNQSDNKPSRIEKKSYSNISEIEIDHKYGDLLVRESNSKQIDLEIQYFDTPRDKASCEISTSKGILFIETNPPISGNGRSTKINYIISIPRNTGLTVNLKYGNMKIDEHRGTFLANISYGNMDANSFSGTTPTIKMKYGNININSATDLVLTAAYSKVQINKANNIKISSDYTDYKIENVQSIQVVGKSGYCKYYISNINKMEMDLKYGDVKIGNLSSDLTASLSYSNIAIGASNSMNSIFIKGTYSDMAISLPEDMPATFDVNLKYGDLSVSKKHTVTYTESIEQNHKVQKKGKIGTKTPKAKIEISNSYADVRIR